MSPAAPASALDVLAAVLAAAAGAARLDAEALARGVRRVHGRELAAAFERGRLLGAEEGRADGFRAGLVAGIALQRRCQREHDAAEGLAS